MKIRALPLLCSVLLLSFSWGQEEAKSYLLASKENPVPIGQTFKVTTKATMNDFPLSITIEDQKIEGKMTRSGRRVVKYEFLAADRVRATILADITTGKQTMAGAETEIDERQPTQGRSFLVVKKDGKWSVDPKPEDVEPADQEAIDTAIERLEKHANNEGETSLKMYGDKPRKIGESWEVDAVALPGMDNIEILGGKITVTFTGLEEFDGEPCAILKAKFKVAGQMDEKSMKGIGVDISGSIKITRSLKFFEDYKTMGRLGMEAIGEMQLQPGLVGTFKMGGDVKVEMLAVKVPQANEK